MTTDLAAARASNLSGRPSTALDVRIAFLAGHHSPRTVESYRRDLTWYFDWCAAYDLDPSPPTGSTSTSE